MRVEDLTVRKIINSRGKWAVELDLKVDGSWYRASVPAGKSRGKHEAVQFPADRSVSLAGEFRKLVLGEYDSQEEFDSRLIAIAGENKSRFGVDLTLAASIAFFRSTHRETGGSLPVPMLNVINGGEHAGNDLAVQEFMIVPFLNTFSERMEAAVNVYQALRDLLLSRFGKSAVNVGDEGGFAPPIGKTEEAVEILEKAIEEAGYGKHVRISLDMAANSYFDGKYRIDGLALDRGEYIEYVIDLAGKFHFFSVEDPMEESDWEGFAEVTRKAGTTVVGDDLLVTHPERVKRAIETGACNAVLVKPNQVGTVSETLEVVELAKKAGWKYIISHRSGETNDPFIAHFAVHTSAPLIKAGAPARGERVAKYNELLKMEE